MRRCAPPQEDELIDDDAEQPYERLEDEPYAEAPEPPITVAVLAGGPGNYAQRAASLASARNLLDQLQTAPYDTYRPSLRAMLARSDAFLAEQGAGSTSGAAGTDFVSAAAAEPSVAAAEPGSSEGREAGGNAAPGGRTAASLPQHLRSGGIHVLTYWLGADMTAHALTAADLMSRSVADLDFRPPGVTPPVASVRVRDRMGSSRC